MSVCPCVGVITDTPNVGSCTVTGRGSDAHAGGRYEISPCYRLCTWPRMAVIRR